jgi:sugar phosphate permease
MYLRQNFEISVLEAFRITASDLGELYSLLGFVFAVSYIPSGWLADRFQPRRLMSFSLVAVGALGFWFATYPPLSGLRLIFLGWGLAGGLCFWASLIKAVKFLARSDEQGRFFGMLDGGRGLVEALLASVAILMFRVLSEPTEAAAVRLGPVILMYSTAVTLFGVLVYFLVSDTPGSGRESRGEDRRGTLLADIRSLAGVPELWLLAVIMMISQMLFWVAYSISAFLQVNLGLTAFAAGFVTLMKLWMRPIGGISIGFIGDRMPKELLLAWLIVLASLSLLAIVYLPLAGQMAAIVATVVLIGYLTYAIKGLYWALLDHCPVPRALTGLAIGLVSFIGYLPDMLLPLYDGWLSRGHPRAEAFQIYFSSIAACGFVGAGICAAFYRRNKARGLYLRRPQSHTAAVPPGPEPAA